jgi:hypothetical protein
MKIDHVSVGGRDLRRLEDAFAEAGMKTEYGGPHSSGLTKMSLLGFRDGSYIELISPTGPDSRPEIWRKQIEEDGGACAWAIEVDDIDVDVVAAKDVGIPTTGPDEYSRTRPDGVVVRWRLGFLGEQEPGAVLPFLIKDITPRDYRVKPSPSVSGTDSTLEGVREVVIGVRDTAATSKVFKTLYGWYGEGEPQVRKDLWEGVELAHFSGTPVTLAAPLGEGWLKDRLARFGPSPCAFFISTTEPSVASKRYPLEESGPWFDGQRASWVAPLKKHGIMIGMVGR